MGSNPIGDAAMARYANRQSDEAQTFMIVQVRLLPASLNQICVGWALASLSGRNPPAFGLWRFDSVPTHFLWRGAMLVLAASLSSSPTRVQFPSALLAQLRLGVMLVLTARPSTWPTRVRFPSGSLEHSQVVKLGYTRRSERRARLGVRVQLSPWLLQRLQVRQVPSWVS